MSGAERGEKPSGPITLDQLLALNEEIAALVRAGLPLDRGLLETGRDVRGRLGRIAGVLGRRLNRGEDLAEALEAERRAIPPLYRAVVEAGARAGRLPAALEGMAQYIRGVSDARAIDRAGAVVSRAGPRPGVRAVRRAALPRGAAVPGGLRIAGTGDARAAAMAGAAPAGPKPTGGRSDRSLIAVLLVVWMRSGTTAGLRGGSWGGLRLFPWMGRLLADFEAANFAELLALLLEHQVPYPSALVLAAEAAGAPRLIDGAGRVAEAIRGGAPVATAVEAAGRGAFPPMLRWTLATGQAQGSLGSALHHMAELYRKRARYRAEQIAVFLPMIFTLGVAGSAVALYAITLFLPLVEILNGLSAG